MKKENLKNNKAITLISLVITIIVLLILAIVSISLVINGGIIEKSEYAKQRQTMEQIEEKIKLKKVEMEMAKHESEQVGEVTVKEILENHGEDTSETISIASGATSIPANMPAGEYYALTPTKYASNSNTQRNVSKYARVTSRGDEREQDTLKDIYVINENLEIYYIIEGKVAEKGIEISVEKDLPTVGYFYNTMYNPKQPEIVTVDEYYDDDNNDKISDINPSLNVYTSGYDFNIPVSFFSEIVSTEGNITATITHYDGTEEKITLTTNNNKKWEYKSRILTGKEEDVLWEEYIALDFYPYAKYSSSPYGYESSNDYHYLSLDAGNAIPFNKLTIFGKTIVFPFNCQAHVGWGDMDFYDNMFPLYTDINKVSKVIVNFSNNTKKEYTRENIFEVDSYFSEDSCFYYSSQNIPILYTNGAFIINMAEASLKTPISSIIVVEEGIATRFNITNSTEVMNSNAWN